MTESFDAVLAEILVLLPNGVYEAGREVLTRLAAAHAAEVGERDARIAELEAELNARVNRQVSEGVRAHLTAARTKLGDAEWRAVCGMFIEAEKVQKQYRARAEAAEQDARRLDWMDRALAERGRIEFTVRDPTLPPNVRQVIDAAIAAQQKEEGK